MTGFDRHPSVALERKYAARNYEPLPVVMVRGEGVHLWDSDGRQYIDMMSAYSAVSFGHSHPRLVAALVAQASRLAVVSRAVHTDVLGPLLEKVCLLTEMDRALPMNTGAEGVETALKAARKWAEVEKGVPADEAEIIACEGNFHGRTISIVGLSTVPQYRTGFGPFPRGLRTVTYGDVDALRDAITDRTAAFLVEPIQGEAGIVVPPVGYLARCAEICRAKNVLLICDEVQTGLGRTGRMLASNHEHVKPDGLVLGKALGGGLLPISMFLARDDVMRVFNPGDHGSTFGGNPLAAAVALEALSLLVDDKLVERSAHLGAHLLERLVDLRHPRIAQIRGRGLFVGVELTKEVSAHDAVLRLLERGLLSKDTHRNTLRLAPPFVIDEAQIDHAVRTMGEVLDAM